MQMAEPANSQDLPQDGPEDGGPPEGLLDFAVSRAPVVFYAADLEDGLKVSYVSDGIETITGHPAAAFLADPGFAAARIHPEDRTRYLRAVLGLRGQGAASVDYRFRDRDGAYRWFRDALRPGSGDGRTFYGCMTQISREKQAEGRLEDAKVLRAAILDAALDVIIVADEDGKIVEFNPVAERTFGQERDEVIGESLVTLILPEAQRDWQLDAMKRFGDIGDGWVRSGLVETEALRSDGSRFPIEMQVREVSLQTTRLFVVELWDITERVDSWLERRILSEERQRLSQLLHDAIESIPNGIGIYDAAGRLVLCNTAYAELYEHDPQAMIATSMEDNHRLALSQLKSWAGEAVDNTEEGLARALGRILDPQDGPVEAQRLNGDWVQITSHPTGDGGRVFVRSDITKLKRAEESLRHSEAQFRAIVEGSPMPVRVADLETWQILYESPAATALVGHSWPSAAPRCTSDDYVDAADRRRLIEILEAEGRVDGYETRLRQADGTLFWAALSARVIVYQGQKVCVTSLVDLTERKEREDELRQAREVLEDAIEALAEGFALYDEEDRLVMCNTRYREFNEVCADVLRPGLAWADMIRIGAERGQFVAATGRIEPWLEERKALRDDDEAELVFQQSDGRWFRTSSRRTRQGGRVGVRSEITAQKEAELAREESEALIRKVVEACPQPIIMATAEEGEVLYESPAFQALLGRDGSQPASRRAQSFYSNPQDRLDYIGRLRRSGQVEIFEAELMRSDGSTFWAELSGRLIDYKGEEVVVCCPADLTERRAVEAEIAHNRDALHQSEKLGALGSLLAGVAHELNNPLSVVVGQALLMKETARDPKIAARAAKIGKAADRCSRIVKTFLAMARQQASERTAVDVTEIVESTLEVTGYSLRTAGIDVTLDLAPDLAPVWADPDQLNQVVTNLIVNAQQAMTATEGPRQLVIASACDRRHGLVTLSVRDSGPGIPPEIRSRIFEPFFTTKEVGAGTGIGLAVCHRIVESLKGEITVESKPGAGAKFTVVLPAAPAQEAPLTEPSATRPRSRACRVLVIDDEKDVTQMLKDILVAEGHDVRAADSGQRAIELLSRHSFDVILSDLRMPNMDGPRLYAKLMELSPSLLRRVAFITGDTFSPKVSEFLKESGRPYVQKPFAPLEVHELIDKVLAAEAEDARSA